MKLCTITVLVTCEKSTRKHRPPSHSICKVAGLDLQLNFLHSRCFKTFFIRAFYETPVNGCFCYFMNWLRARLSMKTIERHHKDKVLIVLLLTACTFSIVNLTFFVITTKRWFPDVILTTLMQIRSSRSRMFYRSAVPKHFAKFTLKHHGGFFSEHG